MASGEDRDTILDLPVHREVREMYCGANEG